MKQIMTNQACALATARKCPDDKVDWAWESKAENSDFKLDKTKKDVAATAKFRRINTTIESAIQNSMNNGSIMCRITSRPGQMGRCDGLILEGKELEFYTRHIIEPLFIEFWMADSMVVFILLNLAVAATSFFVLSNLKSLFSAFDSQAQSTLSSL